MRLVLLAWPLELAGTLSSLASSARVPRWWYISASCYCCNYLDSLRCWAACFFGDGWCRRLLDAGCESSRICICMYSKVWTTEFWYWCLRPPFGWYLFGWVGVGCCCVGVYCTCICPLCLCLLTIGLCVQTVGHDLVGFSGWPDLDCGGKRLAVLPRPTFVLGFGDGSTAQELHVWSEGSMFCSRPSIVVDDSQVSVLGCSELVAIGYARVTVVTSWCSVRVAS